MAFVILGFLAMVLFELVIINEMPAALQGEITGKFDLKFGSVESCVLESIPKDLVLPMNFTCSSDGYLVPFS